jgi:hypothetical protein
MRSLRACWGGAGGRRWVVSSMALLERLRLECLSLQGGSGYFFAESKDPLLDPSLCQGEYPRSSSLHLPHKINLTLTHFKLSTR